MNLLSFLRRLTARLRPTAITIRYVADEPPPALAQPLLVGKWVLVSGVGANIGRAVALEMAQQGANLVLLDQDQGQLAAVEQELGAYSGQVKSYRCDLSRPEQIADVLQQLDQTGLTMNGLVNTAVFYPSAGNFQQLNLSDWQQSLATNLTGPLYLTQQITGRMIAHKIPGSVIFITSVHQWLVKEIIGYSTAKAALGMAVKELAFELAPHRIRVNAIAPGWVKEDEQHRPIFHNIGLLNHSSINPCYIGRAVVYLTADYFSLFTTGTTLTIDGGLSLINYQSYKTTLGGQL